MSEEKCTNSNGCIIAIMSVLIIALCVVEGARLDNLKNKHNKLAAEVQEIKQSLAEKPK